MYKNTYKGRYQVKNPKKYNGNINEVFYRSSWELKFMNWCDNTSAVIEWGSETIVIPYISPVDKKAHRYFVDFFLKIQDKSGETKKYLVEIKPKKFTVPPEIPKRKTKRFIQEVFQYGVNEAKWKAAESYCLDRNWKFLILTEDDLNK